MRKIRMSLFFIAILLLVPAHIRAAQFETFADQNINGKYYPLIDNVQVAVPSQMLFSIHTKTNPNKIKEGPQLPAPKVEISLQLEKNGKKRIMLVNYFIPERNEHLCRRILAPDDFEEGFLVYRDTTDRDLDTYIVSMTPVTEKVGIRKVDSVKYASCEEAPTERFPASTSAAPPAITMGVEKNAIAPSVSNSKIKGKDGSLSDYQKW